MEEKLNPFPNKPWFLRVYILNLLKTPWEKEKLLVTSNFSFSHDVFYLFGRTLCRFHQIQNCRLQTLSVWNRLKFVICERVKMAQSMCIRSLTLSQTTNVRLFQTERICRRHFHI